MHTPTRHRLLAVLAGALLANAAHADSVAVPAGLATFDRICAACHQAGGTGTPGVAPALAGTLAPLVAADDGKRYIAGVLTQGLSGRIASQGQMFMGAMPSQATLSDAELADVANYLARDLNGAPASPFAAADFAQAREAKAPHKDLRDLRQKLIK
jgi:mono/diheme cytochrome c family protein